MPKRKQSAPKSIKARVVEASGEPVVEQIDVTTSIQHHNSESKQEDAPVWYTHHHVHDMNNPFAYSVVELQGRRHNMEDAFAVHTVPQVGVKTSDSQPSHPVSLFGVFDGHGGTHCVSYIEEKLLAAVSQHRSFARNPRRALAAGFSDLDDEFCAIAKEAQTRDGTTATVAVLKKDHPKKPLRLILANTGDTRAVLVNSDSTVEVLTRDHNAHHEDERNRIFDSGGTIFHDTDDNTYRVGGVLAVSRAFGNHYLKPFVTAEPEVVDKVLSSNSTYLVIASDGLWDCVKSDEVGPILSSQGVEVGAATLAETAYHRGSFDNICVLVVDLHSIDLAEKPNIRQSTRKKTDRKLGSGMTTNDSPRSKRLRN